VKIGRVIPQCVGWDGMGCDDAHWDLEAGSMEGNNYGTGGRKHAMPCHAMRAGLGQWMREPRQGSMRNPRESSGARLSSRNGNIEYFCALLD